jgi:hypothetical protein
LEVPVTSVESQALFGRDDAADDLVRLHVDASRLVNGFADLLGDVGRDPGPSVQALMSAGAGRLVVLAYARFRRLAEPAPIELSDADVVDHVDGSMSGVFQLCQSWGYDTKQPEVSKERADLLAVDLTEMWCTSHLRVGVRRDRSRGELCDWCYRHGPLLVATWAAPPRELVRLHVEKGKVYAHQIDPLIRAERDRQRTLAKRSR